MARCDRSGMPPSAPKAAGPCGAIVPSACRARSQAPAEPRFTETIDEIDFPITRTIGGIGRIERGLPVREAGKGVLQLLECGLRAVGGDGLGNELAIALGRKQAHEIVGRVVTERVRRRHHDAGILQDLITRGVVATRLSTIAAIRNPTAKAAKITRLNLARKPIVRLRRWCDGRGA